MNGISIQAVRIRAEVTLDEHIIGQRAEVVPFEGYQVVHADPSGLGDLLEVDRDRVGHPEPASEDVEQLRGRAVENEQLIGFPDGLDPLRFLTHSGTLPGPVSPGQPVHHKAHQRSF